MTIPVLVRVAGKRWRARGALSLVLWTLGSCSDPAGEATGILPVPDLASDWLGDYRGFGQGTIDGQPAFVTNVELSIAYDSGDQISPDCTGCVTVTLDDDFLLSNVAVDHRTDLSLSYRDGVVLYTLLLHRPILGVDNTNLLEAYLTIGNHDAPSPIVELEYLLERP